MNSQVLDEKYEGLMEVEVLNEEDNSIRYYYYAKDIGLVGIKSEKKLVFFLFRIYNGLGGCGSNLNEVKDSVATDSSVTLIRASFPGGIEAFSKYVASNVSFTRNAILKEAEGVVYVRFSVCHDGKVNNVNVVKGIDPELNEQAIMVIKASPDWIPAIQNNQEVTSVLQIPIRFSLPEANANRTKGKKSRR